MRYFALVLIGFLITGCGEYSDDKSAEETVQTYGNKDIMIRYFGIGSTAVVLKIANHDYHINEDGIFSRSVVENYNIEITQHPDEEHCFLFDDVFAESVDHHVECYDKQIGFSDKKVEVGEYFSYYIKEDTRVLYSSEAVAFTPNEDEEIEEDFIASSTFNAGLYLDDGGVGNTMSYITDEIPIADIEDESALHERLEEIIGASKYVVGVQELYSHDADILTTKEYAVALDRSITAAEMIRELSQNLKVNLEQPLIVLMPHVHEDAVRDNSLIVGVSLYPSLMNNRLLYMFHVRAASVMGDGQHFPTPNLTSDDE
jgi:hypothetical protein